MKPILLLAFLAAVPPLQGTGSKTVKFIRSGISEVAYIDLSGRCFVRAPDGGMEQEESRLCRAIAPVFDRDAGVLP